MGAGAGSVTDNTSTFESNLKAQCYSASSASNYAAPMDVSNSTNCSITVLQDATSYANCTVEQVAAAVAETAQTTSSAAESDLLPSISVSDAESASYISQYLETECTSDSAAENFVGAIKAMGATGCDFYYDQTATSTGQCAATIATSAITQTDQEANSSSETTAMSSFFAGLSSVISSYGWLIFGVIFGIALIIAIPFIANAIKPGSASDVIKATGSAASSVAKSVAPAATMVGGLLSDTSPAFGMTEALRVSTSPALTISQFML